jgi:hypothetical protein
MNKNKISLITKIIFTLFLISTCIILFMSYKDFNNSFAYKFAMVYVCLIVFIILYIPFITLYSLKKLKWIEIRKILIRFTLILLFLGTSNHIFDYYFRPSNIDLFREFSTAFGIAFGATFGNIIFQKIIQH